MKASLNIINSTFSIDQNKDIPLDTHHYSITVNGFKDRQEADLMLSRINDVIKNSKGRVKVYGK